MKQKKKSFTDRMRENPWIFSTLVLVFVVIVLLVDISYGKFNSEEITEINLCDIISGTPAWVLQGRIMDYGYKGNISVDYLIQNDVGFLYKEGCGYCQAQIQGFDNWTKYQESGLTKECS